MQTYTAEGVFEGQITGQLVGHVVMMLGRQMWIWIAVLEVYTSDAVSALLVHQASRLNKLGISIGHIDNYEKPNFLIMYEFC